MQPRACFLSVLFVSFLAAGSAAAQPDLQVSVLSVSPTSQVPGGSVTITYRVYNAGDATAASFSIRFYHSTDATITTSDTPLQTKYINSVAAGGYYPASSNATASVTLPGTLPVGAGYIGAIVDYDNSVTESDETNNTASTPITILPPDVDLQVTTLSVAPTSQSPGGSVTVTYRVHNAGSTPAGAFHLRFYHSTDATITTSDTYLGSDVAVTSLAAGANYPTSSNGTVNVTLPGSLTPGSGYIGAIVDYDNSVTETNETNNTASTPFTVLPPDVDLQVTNLSVSPTSQSPGGSVTVTYRIRNTGSTAAGSFTLRFYHSTDATITTSDTYLGSEVPVGSLAAGAYYPTSANGTVSATLPGSLPVGSGYIGAIVDYDNSVTETNETNNTASTPFTVLPPDVDLQVTNLSVSPTSQAPGSSVTITYRVRNTGSAAAGSFTLRFYHSTDATITTSDTYLGSEVPVGSLAAGAYYPASANGTVSATLPGTLTPGSGYIGAIVDYDNSVTETNETNNTASTPITILAPPKPDLQVTTLSVSPTSASPGQSVTITYQLYNAGNAPGIGFYVRFYYSSDTTITTSDTYLGAQIGVGGLTPGYVYNPSTVAATLPALPAGAGYIGAIIDYDDSVDESDETNNTRSTPFTVLAPLKPDLQLTTLSVAPTSAAPGGSVAVTYRVQNTGAGAASAFHLRFYHSSDATITTSDTYLGSDVAVSSLAAGAYYPASSNGTVNVTLPGSLPAGASYIGAIVDYDDSVNETNETNNTSSTAFTVLSGGGISCTSASQCSSGFCVDGVCCNTACGGGAVDCQACSTAAGGPVNGTCSMLSSATVCRPAAGICDEAETCTGASPTCPTDLFKVSGTTCRVAAGLCDEVEVCSGSSATCPTDALKPAGAVCRAAAGECDLAEQCTGTTSCPTDLYKPNGLPCTGGLCSGGTCVAAPDSGLPDQGLDGGVDVGPEAGVDASVEAGVDGPAPGDTTGVDGPGADGPTTAEDGAVDVSAPDAAPLSDGIAAPDLARDGGSNNDSGDGCSCQLGAVPTRGGAALALLLLLGLALWRRRA